jgi:hypothetical protein
MPIKRTAVAMTQLALDTGGKIVAAPQRDDLTAIYERIAADVSNLIASLRANPAGAATAPGTRSSVAPGKDIVLRPGRDTTRPIVR